MLQRLDVPFSALPVNRHILIITRQVWTGQYLHVADCFSSGVLMFVLLSGTMPHFQSAVPELPDEDWSDVSQPAIELMLGLLAAEPRQRTSASNALQHSW